MNMRLTYTIAFYDKTTGEKISLDTTTSIEACAKDHIGKGTATMAAAMMAYGDATVAYVANPKG